MRLRSEDLVVGRRYGVWTVLEVGPAAGSGRSRRHKCRCVCGHEKHVETKELGSRAKQRCGGHGPKHRESVGGPTAEYRSWHAMKARCNRPSATGYKNYGGRGIRVCERWAESYAAFLSDVGRRPSPAHTLDRIDVNGHYEPGNVRWATHAEQHRNMRGNRMIEYGGERLTLMDWAIRYDIRWKTLAGRIDAGWDIEAALTVPPTYKNAHRGLGKVNREK